MNRQDRARELLAIVSLLGQAQKRLDALSVGDPSGIPNELKHTLDEPRERIRTYARMLYMGETPARSDQGAGND